MWLVLDIEAVDIELCGGHFPNVPENFSVQIVLPMEFFSATFEQFLHYTKTFIYIL
jgi:hypothetical protein